MAGKENLAPFFLFLPIKPWGFQVGGGLCLPAFFPTPMLFTDVSCEWLPAGHWHLQNVYMWNPQTIISLPHGAPLSSQPVTLVLTFFLPVDMTDRRVSAGKSIPHPISGGGELTMSCICEAESISGAEEGKGHTQKCKRGLILCNRCKPKASICKADTTFQLFFKPSSMLLGFINHNEFGPPWSPC